MSRIDYIPLGSYPTKKTLEGRYICQNCSKVIEVKRRYKYCSEDCCQEFFRKNNHSAMRTWLIYKRGQSCEKCGTAVIDSWDLVLDHILPIALGGEQFGDESNLQLLCPKCNKEKTSRDISEIAQNRRITRIQDHNRKIGEFV
jgi:5-methylcytosine-specific restriction endonuclease McrA